MKEKAGDTDPHRLSDAPKMINVNILQAVRYFKLTLLPWSTNTFHKGQGEDKLLGGRILIGFTQDLFLTSEPTLLFMLLQQVNIIHKNSMATS